MGKKFHKAWVVTKLAYADIRHEWLMSLCLILAIVAMASPLLLFFGLKSGIVDTLRYRLSANPVTLEIKPNTDKLLDEKWFSQWDTNPLVAFVVPHTRKLAAQADVRLETGNQTRKRLDIIPTLPKDILLLHYNQPVPLENQCVLSEKAAELLQGKIGDFVDFQVTRDLGKSSANHTFEVVGILPMAGNSLTVAYIPLKQLEYIEEYKDGKAVPAFGWTGTEVRAYPVFTNLIIETEKALDTQQVVMIQQNTGFRLLSSEITNAPYKYFIQSVGSSGKEENYRVLREKLRGTSAILIPSLDPTLTFTLKGLDESLKVKPLTSISPGVTTLKNLGEKPEFWLDPLNKELILKLLVSQEIYNKLNTDSILAEVLYTRDGESKTFTFPIKLIPLETNEILAPQNLLVQLNLLLERSLLYSEQGSAPQFLLDRRGYSGFRMYAANIESVSPLAKELESLGISVTTQANRIEEVLQMDAYLSLLFWLIATASLIGGTACLLSSVYANVERKRKELAVLRLLGVHGAELTVFSLVSSSLLTLIAFLCSLGIYYLLAGIINQVFANSLQPGEAFCKLSLEQQLQALGLALLLSLCAGAVASLRIARIEPAESLRDE